MNYSVAYEEAENFISIKYYGEIDLDTIRAGAQQAAQLAKSQGTFYILVDCRDAILKLSTVSIYKMPKVLGGALAEVGLDIHRFRRAVVYSQQMEDFKFAEAVTFNNMQMASVFFNYAEAKAWLLGN